MATRPTLPYFAPADSLPAPLPTVAEILAVIPRPKPKRNVVQFGEHFVIKFGQRVRLQEGENMLFVRQSTRVPVPTVYALFHDEESGNNFIIQEYIAGSNLYTYWRGLDQSGKEAIASQLRQHLDELRSLPSPGYFGGVWRQPIRCFYFTGTWDRDDEPPALACDTEEQWVDELTRRAHAAGNHNKDLDLWKERMLRLVLRGHSPVFTHGDLDRTNIRVRSDGTVVFIDWERSGWYPSCWEYCLATHVDGCTDDWHHFLPRLFEQEWPGEVAWMLILRDWLMFGHFYI
ncbi:kinase-like protein [Coniochaeta ligniaria NRRL 30616]|uniref:Kinase-like protein n=1 Tax=Coniochaeta ligniaria NRRL 30616 TaxID=1408157 RepID=A0A1J7JX32_9PEZI|nr:kinase-like protein [Coniochaeta ligniaria NRRL 30616]